MCSSPMVQKLETWGCKWWEKDASHYVSHSQATSQQWGASPDSLVHMLHCPFRLLVSAEKRKQVSISSLSPLSSEGRLVCGAKAMLPTP